MSAVSVWEIALLVDSRQVELDSPIEAWIARFLERPGIEPAPLGYRAACRSYRLYQLEHRDPADRASDRYAIELACPLVAYDERILRFAADYGGQYRFAARTLIFAASTGHLSRSVQGY